MRKLSITQAILGWGNEQDVEASEPATRNRNEPPRQVFAIRFNGEPVQLLRLFGLSAAPSAGDQWKKREICGNQRAR
jgi:hypothetical protein